MKGGPPKHNHLSNRSLRILAYLIDHTRTPVTIRDLMNATKISSTNGIEHHLKRLEQMGLLSRQRLKAGTIRPTCQIILFDSTVQPQ